MNNMKPTVKLDNVSMYYHDKNTVNIGISKISLEFYKGEFVAITGESGSGKTSLLNVIGASLGYHDGEVYYDGEPSSYFDEEDRETFRRKRIGYVCQNYNLIDSYTLIQNVLAAMIISGWNIKDAEPKALEYLDKVGLKDLAYQKASRISSGQKQRLGIARALAKETDIILADEPTGNLDSENGMQIVKLLKELSKDHLVIMVTHNIDEATAYASRIVRLSDGHVVLDEKREDVTYLESSFSDEKDLNPYKVAWSFANFNRSAKPKRSVFLSVFLMLISITMFVFIGTIIANMDDSTTKIYDPSAFLNEQMNRIIVMKDDKSDMTDEDVDKVNELKYVLQVDKYDLVNDYNYYLPDDLVSTPQAFYEYDSNGFPIEETVEIRYIPTFNDFGNYLKSVTCIKNEKLLAGTMPVNINDIVIYGTKNDVGQKRTIYFQIRGERGWNVTSYIALEMTISGVLASDNNFSKDQIYYSEKFCKQMVYNSKTVNRKELCYSLSPIEPTPFRPSTKYVYLFVDDIGEDNIKLSQSFFGDSRIINIYNKVGFNIYEFNKLNLNIISFKELMSADMVVVDDSNYDKYFSSVTSNQLSVYIEDYAYTDEVIDAINNLGYTAMSSYRVSTLEYDLDKLNDRNVTIIVCVIAVLVIFALTLFVLVAFLSLNQSDYLLLRFIGMDKKTMYLTNLFEMLVTAVCMFVVAIIITYALDLFNFTLIHNIIKYMVWYQFVILFIVDIFIVWATTARFNRTLQKKALQGTNE